MSDQGKSNLQMFAAGLGGFIAVFAVGGGALMFFSRQAKTAAQPIDLGSTMPRTEPSSLQAQKERRAESPAPLMGAQDEEAAAEASASAAVGTPDVGGARSLAASSGSDKKYPALKATEHLSQTGHSTAQMTVKDAAFPKKKPAKAGAKGVALKIDPATGANAVASEHYGVTRRSELMGRAVGPVYNFKGAGKGKGTGAAGKKATDEITSRVVADLQKQLEAAGLPADQRAKLQADLDAAGFPESAKTAP